MSESGAIDHDERPTASLDTLRRRAQLLAETRRFFDSAGFFEVDTPLLSADRVIDPHLEPFVARGAESASSTTKPAYLQTSPEFAMKRLLCEGAQAIYQLGKVFRAGERGARHNPEFTMLEWYRVGDDHESAMRLTEAYLRSLAAVVPRPPAWDTASFRRITYREAFEARLGFDPHRASTRTIVASGLVRGVSPPQSLEEDDRDGWLNWLLAEFVEPSLGSEQPEFLVDYPASQAALARLGTDAEGTKVAERFELYWRGVELCNGYHELTDAAELRSRIATETTRRASEGLPPLDTDNRLLRAMDRGLPPCAGNAVGFDRFVMLLLGFERIDEVVPFPFERA